MEYGWTENNACVGYSHHEVQNPLSIKMKNGFFFRVDNVSLAYHKTLLRQLAQDNRVELKFCTKDDEDTPSAKNIEQWEIVFFPMFLKDKEEVVHGVIVDYEDSAVNGNLVIENGKVTSASSNHCLLGYDEVQNAVVEYAKDYIQEKLDRCR